jgi:glutamyl-tRNA reductase
MRIYAVGLSHHKAPIEIREKIAYAESELEEAAPRLKSSVGVTESVLISTCNRVEAYLAHNETIPARNAVRRFLEEDRKAQGLDAHLYCHEGYDAVRHLFRVAAGLDSMVVGENEILGQVKRAYLAAYSGGTTGRILNRLFQFALHVAKSVRSSTSISSGHASVASVAVTLAEKIFGTFESRRGLIVGAGEIGEAAAAAFKRRGLGTFTVANRTEETARTLAESLGGKACSLDDIPDQLPSTDVVISCAPVEILTVGRFRSAAASRPLFVIDIAVPRSVDPAVNKIENVFLYDIDDLESIAAENAARRAQEIEQSEKIIHRETEKLLSTITLYRIEDVIRRLTERYEEVAAQELEWLLPRLQDIKPEQREAIEQMLHRLVRKLIHPAVEGMKDSSQSQLTAELFRRLFDLK